MSWADAMPLRRDAAAEEPLLPFASLPETPPADGVRSVDIALGLVFFTGGAVQPLDAWLAGEDPPPPRLTVARIRRCVAARYGISETDILSRRRSRGIARPRQVAMYLAAKLTTASLPEIGRRLGDLDHTTVSHGRKRIQQLLGEDAELAENVRLLSAQLGQPVPSGVEGPVPSGVEG